MISSLRAAVLAVGAAPMLLAASPGRASAQAPGDSAAVAAVVDRYHGALAVIVESGGIESRKEYRSHHLPADIAFVRAVKGTRSAVRVAVRGDVGWRISAVHWSSRSRSKQ